MVELRASSYGGKIFGLKWGLWCGFELRSLVWAEVAADVGRCLAEKSLNSRMALGGLMFRLINKTISIWHGRRAVIHVFSIGNIFSKYCAWLTICIRCILSIVILYNFLKALILYLHIAYIDIQISWVSWSWIYYYVPPYPIITVRPRNVAVVKSIDQSFSQAARLLAIYLALNRCFNIDYTSLV